MRRRLLAIVLLVCAGSSASPASAMLESFSSRDLWRNAAGGGTGDLTENFDEVAIDEPYGPSPVAAGFLTLRTTMPALPGETAWQIDKVPNLTFPAIPSVNGTSFATTLVIGDVATELGFPEVKAIGFDFGPATMHPGQVTLTTSRGDTATFQNSAQAGGFVGLLYTEGETFTGLQWSSTTTVHAGIDNVEAFSPVPLPPALILLGSALGCIAIRRVKRR